MKELKKVESMYFKECYEGKNELSHIEVNCILDDDCVRYAVCKNGHWGRRHEFSNDKKDLCFKNATKALNK